MVSCQLNCLNLSNNRIHKLDEFADLVTKVPQLKTLNLSHNEVTFSFKCFIFQLFITFLLYIS